MSAARKAAVTVYVATIDGAYRSYELQGVGHTAAEAQRVAMAAYRHLCREQGIKPKTQSEVEEWYGLNTNALTTGKAYYDLGNAGEVRL